MTIPNVLPRILLLIQREAGWTILAFLHLTLHCIFLTYNAFIISDFLLRLSKKDVQESRFGLQDVDLVVTIRYIYSISKWHKSHLYLFSWIVVICSLAVVENSKSLCLLVCTGSTEQCIPPPQHWWAHKNSLLCMSLAWFCNFVW